MASRKVVSKKEKLAVVEKELKALHKKCIDAGYDPNKIRKVADPILKVARRGNVKKAAKTILILTIVAAVFTGMFYIEPCYWQMRVMTKKIMVKLVMPYYDWTWIYLSDCLWENPFYDPPVEKVSKDDCKPCHTVDRIEARYNVKEEEITESLYEGIPAVVADDMKDWRTSLENVTIETFLDMYANNPKITEKDDNDNSKTGYFRTTKDLKEGINNSYDLSKWALEELENGGDPQFTVHWGNNHIDSFKELHAWYTKPAFLPPMCEPVRHKSYLMVGRRGEDKGKGLVLRPRYGETGIWIAQICGQNEFIVQPIKDCLKYCKKIRFVLKEGQMLNVPTALYDITYRPNSTEAVAIGVGYEFQ